MTTVWSIFKILRTEAYKKRILEEFRSTEYLRCRSGPTILRPFNESIKLAIVTANNHHAGFGPGTANIFRNMLGLPEANWEDRGKEQEASRHHDLGGKAKYANNL